MKTSKRLLSLLLAVVMALTAFSVGFVAFAEEVNPTNSNSLFSAENASKDKSVEALSDLVNDLLPDILTAINAEGALTDLGVSVDDIANMEDGRFHELMVQLSPWLYNDVLGGMPKVDKYTALETLGVSIAANGGVSFYKGNAPAGYDEASTRIYASALFGFLEDKDAETDFWSLYSNFADNANANGTEYEKLCAKYKDEMESFVKAEFKKYTDTDADENIGWVYGVLETFYNEIIAPLNFNDNDYDMGITVEEINRRLSTVKPTTSLDAAALNDLYAFLEYFVKLAAPDYEINWDMAKAVYYVLQFSGTAYGYMPEPNAPLISGIYNRLANEGDANLAFNYGDNTWYDAMPGTGMNAKAKAYAGLFCAPYSTGLNAKGTYYNAINKGVQKVFGVTMPELNGDLDIVSGLYYDRGVAEAYAYAENYISNKFDASLYPIDSKYMLEIVNSTINGFVGMIGSLDKSITDMVEAVLADYIKAEDKDGNKITIDFLVNNILKDVYINLANDPVGTIANMVPLLTILVDEFLVPFLFHEKNDAFSSTLEINGKEETQLITFQTVFTLVSGLLGNSNPEIAQVIESLGVNAYDFDLNKIVPDVLNYMNNTTGYKFNYYSDIMTTDGTRKVPIIFNVEVIDTALADYLYNYEFLNMIEGMDNNLKTIVGDAVKKLVSALIKSVDTYLAEHRNDVVLAANGEVLGSGLNNISVALPELFDNFGKTLLADLGIESDWQYGCRVKYEQGKKNVVIGIGGNAEHIYKEEPCTIATNVTVEQLKSFMLDESDAATDITGWIVEFVVSDVLNSIIDLFNLILTSDSELTKRIPMVMGVLDSLGSFTDVSVFTDIFNGFFGLTRDSKFSFSFAERAIPGAKNGETYVGLSEDSAYYLIANIGAVIHAFLNMPQADNTTEEVAQLLAPYAETAAEEPVRGSVNVTVPDFSQIITKGNVESAEKLIAVLDDLLSTLLENAYIDGFRADQLDGILSGVVTFLANYLGKTATDDLLGLVQKYIAVINAENTDETGSWNGNTDGTVDKKKVFSDKNLSTLITETYVFVEDVVDYLIANSIGGDAGMLVSNAVKGIVAPGAVVSRSEYLNKELLGFSSWKDIRESKYAGNLGFAFAAGDKDAFYANFYDSLGIISAIFGGLLCTNNAQGTNLYNDALMPLLNQINAKLGIDLLPEATNGRDVLVAFTQGIGDFVNALLAAPATTLLSTLAGLAGSLQDEIIRPIAKCLVDTVIGELNGLIGGNSALDLISPALKGMIYDLLEQAVPGISGTLQTVLSFNIAAILDSKDLVNLLFSVVFSFIDLGIDLKLPKFDWADLGKSTPAEFLLKVFGIAGDTVLKNEYILTAILGADTYASMKDILSAFDARTILTAVCSLLSLTTSPTEAYWTFDHYIGKASNSSFKYPEGITANDADNAVKALDNLVANVFPLLQQFNVVQQGSLTELLNGLAFTNANLTALAKALYGIEMDATIASVLGAIGLNLNGPKALAANLTEAGHKNTFNDAAKVLANANSWDDVKELNWGFKDGSAKASQGFMNALAAILRPVLPILNVLLGEGSISVNEILTVVNTLDLYMPEAAEGLTVSLKDGILTLTVDLAPIEGTEGSTTNVITVDLANAIASLDELALYGANGYESAIVPLLEALMCDDLKTFDEYCKDAAKDTDNILLNILNPLLGFVNKLAAAPIDTLTAVLPNLAYFIDNNGIAQLLDNLLAPVTHTILPALAESGVDIDAIIEKALGSDLGGLLGGLIGADLGVNISLANLSSCNIQDALVPLINSLLPGLGVDLKLPAFDWATIASHGTQKTVASAARNSDGDFSTIRIVADQGETLVAVLRYVEALLVNNTSALEALLGGLLKDADPTIKNIVSSVFNHIKVAKKDDIVKAVFYLLMQQSKNAFFDYTGFEFKDYDFTYPTTIDMEFLNVLAPMIDGILTGVLDQFMPGGLGGLISDNLYKDSLVSSLVTGLYGAVEGVKIDDNTNLAQLLAMTGIDFTTDGVAAVLTDKAYGQSYDAVAKAVKDAGTWSKVSADKLVWGVKDRDSFLHALTAALRPIFGVLDVLLNNGSLGLFNLVYIPGSDGYTSAVVPLMEAFGLYNIKTQYQYREDINKEYDAILLDILNPLLDKVEDILNAPIQMLADMLPNLALFFANDGLLQLIDNLLLPISALLEALEPIVNVNAILPAVGLDVKAELGKIGINIEKFDLYDLKGTLEPVIGSANILGVVNALLKNFNLGVELMPIDWYQLASHGTVVTDEASQAATYGGRIYVVSNRNEVLVAVLRYLINTINYKDNLTVISDLVGSLMGDGADPTVSDVIGQVLGMLNGETDEVLSQLCELLQTFA